MPLTATAIKNARATEKPLKLFDGGGMFLLVNPNGSRWWRLKYRYLGKEKQLSLGTYPEVSLKDARDRRDEARKQLANGIDPSEHRKAQKSAVVASTENAFEVVAREWYEKYSQAWAPGHADKIIRRLERDVFPWIGKRPIGEITAPELLAILRRIESRGAIETSHRALQNCGRVFRYAVATGRAVRDPCGDLRGALTPVKERHHASITEPKRVGELMRAIEGYNGALITKCALGLAPLLFVRPGELRKAEWSEFELDGAEWRIPAKRMKAREQHIVPLSRQALDILRELHAATGEKRFVFPGARTNGRSMSENTVNAALRRLGYSRECHRRSDSRVNWSG
ncbi:MAG: DUF4102 domain-containing protein [Betaproteobacteria bacterium]|nr:DUF4102 domain-containing protein [Betaproteobacteria bacterium]